MLQNEATPAPLLFVMHQSQPIAREAHAILRQMECLPHEPCLLESYVLDPKSDHITTSVVQATRVGDSRVTKPFWVLESARLERRKTRLVQLGLAVPDWEWVLRPARVVILYYPNSYLSGKEYNELRQEFSTLVGTRSVA